MSDFAATIIPALVREILHAADPGPAVHGYGELLRTFAPSRVLAVGKASHAMADAAAPFVGDGLRAGLIISPPLRQPRLRPLPGFVSMEADHPLPTDRNLAAAAAAADLVGDLGPGESLLVLLSGGASALLTLPVPGLSLGDLRDTTSALLRAGATIDELNCIRKHCERLKGGGLARLAAEAGCPAVLTLILSDVVGDRLDVIGSGPTAADPTTFGDAMAVLERYRLTERLPAVMRHLRAGAAGIRRETLKPGESTVERVRNIVIGANAHAVERAAATLIASGFATETRTEVTGEARDIGVQLAAKVRSLAASIRSGDRGPRAVVWGGETTVTVRGDGKGGRNQELALAAAIALDGVPNCLVMSFATDGVDGQSEAAGAIVTGETLMHARGAGLDADAALAGNDSFTFFARLDDTINEKGRRMLIRTGPTGTNVNDVMIGLAWAEGSTPAAA